MCRTGSTASRRRSQLGLYFFGALLFIVLFIGLWIPGTVRAATQAPFQTITRTNALTQRLLRDATPTAGRVNIGDSQSQDFFSPQGSTVISTDSDGNWSNIGLTPTEITKAGAVTLNMRIDMTHDFSFNWQVQMKAGSNPIADGIGFALHPTYKIGDLSPDQKVAQDIHAIGHPGGNLGTADLMNAFGFKLDSYFNYGRDPGTPGVNYSGPIANTYYGDDSHYYLTGGEGDVYGDADNRIDGDLDYKIPQSNYTQWGPYGIFTRTDQTGYVTYTASQDGTAEEEKPLNGTNNSPNLLGGDWQNMNISYDASTYALSVTLTDPKDTSRTITWKRILSAAEQAQVNTNQYYAFTILGSTGGYYAKQAIQRLSGYFTPENPSLLIRKTTTNGTSVAPTDTVTQQTTSDTKAPTTITDQNTPFQGTLSHILFTYYDSNGDAVTQRVDPTSRDATDWHYLADLTKHNSLGIVTYVYRRTNDLPTLAFTYAGATDGKITVQPNTNVSVTASLTNPTTGPITWMKPYVYDEIPKLLKLANGDNPQVTQDATDNHLKIAFDNIAQSQTATEQFVLHYQGTQPATLYTGGAPADSLDLNLGNNAYIYDESPENLDASGKRIDSSYYYAPTTLDAPLASPRPGTAPDLATYVKMDPGNFVPKVGNVQPAAQANFHYWDITSAGATTMDPGKTGHPTADITGSAAAKVTGQLGDAITAPSTKAPAGFEYLGCYESITYGAPSTWHDASETAPTFYFQSTVGNIPDQKIAYIYRPINAHYLSLVPPDLEFGKHPVNSVSQSALQLPMTQNAQTTITDNRPHTGIPDSTGAWTVTVAATGALTGNQSGAVPSGAQLIFAAPTASSANTITTTGGTLPVTAGNSVQLAQASTYTTQADVLQWGANDIQLSIPQQNVTPDVYQTTLTWTIKDGL